jgi:hypothetical protein
MFRGMIDSVTCLVEQTLDAVQCRAVQPLCIRFVSIASCCSSRKPQTRWVEKANTGDVSFRLCRFRLQGKDVSRVHRVAQTIHAFLLVRVKFARSDPGPTPPRADKNRTGLLRDRSPGCKAEADKCRKWEVKWRKFRFIERFWGLAEVRF